MRLHNSNGIIWGLSTIGLGDGENGASQQVRIPLQCSLRLSIILISRSDPHSNNKLCVSNRIVLKHRRYGTLYLKKLVLVSYLGAESLSFSPIHALRIYMNIYY